MRASLEVKDYAGASRRSSELEVVGVPQEMKPEIAVLRGRLAEALGHDKDALGRLSPVRRELVRSARGRRRPSCSKSCCARSAANSRQAEVLRELETLSAIWRGDAIEVKTQVMMAQIYADTGSLRGIAGRHQDGDPAAAECRTDAAEPGCGLGTVRATLSQPQGRGHEADRCARHILRVSRTDADRASRRRDDPAPGGPAGRGRLARSGSRTAAVPGRQAAGGGCARAGGGAPGNGLSE